MKWCEVTRLEVIDSQLIHTELGYIDSSRCIEFMDLYPDTFTPWQNENSEGLADGTVSVVDKVSTDGPYLLVTSTTSYPPDGFTEITDLNNL
jgi:hypothetical protein